MALLFFLVSFGTSVAGGICGIGGGGIIKPVLDFWGIASVAAASFLSGCTVLSMSLYNVGGNLAGRSAGIELRTGTPLALGAAAGGLLGSRLFSWLRSFAPSEGAVGAVQSICLLILVLGTLIYTLKKSSIRPHQVRNPAGCAVIGLGLGAFSSFLGIGGGPFNLVVLHYFFAMETKRAAANSLYIILFSQIANLLSLCLTSSIPEFQPQTLALMVSGGICGGVLGRRLSKQMDNETVDRLFIGLLVVIIGICLYNTGRYLSFAPA